MYLLIDAGNTRIKWALTESDTSSSDWLAQGSTTHDALAGLIGQWQAAAKPLLAVRAVWIANVAGDALAQQLTDLLDRAGISPTTLHWFTSAPLCAGVRNGYRHPTQLGCDRFAALVGARHRHPDRDLLVVNAGTATTVDALTVGGHFIGGMILPGLRTMAQSLAVNTAQLPSVSDATLEQTLADNTRQAIISGCISAQTGAIERAFAQHPGRSPLCLLSGGAAPFIAPHLQVPHETVPNLVLRGLQVAATTEVPA